MVSCSLCSWNSNRHFFVKIRLMMNISKGFYELSNSSDSLTPFQARIRCALVCVICYTGLFFDIILLYAIIKDKLIKSGCMIFVISLLAIFFTFLSVIFPLNVIIYFFPPPDSWSAAYCYGYYAFSYALTIAEAFLEMSLAINRFAAITFPIFYRDFCTKHFSVFVAVCIFLLSVVVVFPLGVGEKGARRETGKTTFKFIHDSNTKF